MIIIKDALTGDELISDAYKRTLSEDGTMWIFESKLTQRRVGAIDDKLIGGNASAEEVGDDLEEASVSGFEFVLDNNLKEKPFEGKNDFGAYLKNYFKELRNYIIEKHPEKEEEFKKGSQGFAVHWLKKVKDLSFYVGASQDDKCLPIIVEWNDDGVSAKIYILKDGVIEEKF